MNKTNLTYLPNLINYCCGIELFHTFLIHLITPTIKSLVERNFYTTFNNVFIVRTEIICLKYDITDSLIQDHCLKIYWSAEGHDCSYITYDLSEILKEYRDYKLNTLLLENQD